MGMVMLAASGCELFENPLEVDVQAEADRLRRELAAAQVHRGGIQRFALHNLVDNVAVRVEQDGTARSPDRLKVTVYEVDPVTRGFVQGVGGPKVLEEHRGLRNATMSQIQSEYVLFYYDYKN